MSEADPDPWTDLQELLMRKNTLRERMQQRKREREGLLKDVTTVVTSSTSSSAAGNSVDHVASSAKAVSSSKRIRLSKSEAEEPKANLLKPASKDPAVEAELLSKLSEPKALPLDSVVLSKEISANLGRPVDLAVVENFLKKFEFQALISVKSVPRPEPATGTMLTVTSVEFDKLGAFSKDCSSFGMRSRSGSYSSATSAPVPGSDSQHSPAAAGTAAATSTSEASGLTASHHQAVLPRNSSSSTSLTSFLEEGADAHESNGVGSLGNGKASPTVVESFGAASPSDDIMSLLSMQTTKEREKKKLSEEVLELLSKPTAKERSTAERFRSQGGAQVQEFCSHGTRDECRKAKERASKLSSAPPVPCRKLHFRKIIQKHTDEALGDCSFLNTCFHMDTCKYVHYQVDYEGAALSKKDSNPVPPSGEDQSSRDDPDSSSSTSLVALRGAGAGVAGDLPLSPLSASSSSSSLLSLLPRQASDGEVKNKAHEVMMRPNETTVLFPAQWIQCDLRYFDMSILGKFAVVMADPPWDIHMELPYGTMSDDEMRQLNVPSLQDDGLIFLWVTGRAMELGRECLALWGYERVDELIWVKTNQLQRIIRTGRTGHWLNHGKEHCLVGMKGNPVKLNRGLDCDVIVAEVRATSHKPDEIYGIIERLSPGTRKIELFGRQHNAQPNWITLGNQLDGIRLTDPELQDRFMDRYPDGNVMNPPKMSL